MLRHLAPRGLALHDAMVAHESSPSLVALLPAHPPPWRKLVDSEAMSRCQSIYGQTELSEQAVQEVSFSTSNIYSAEVSLNKAQRCSNACDTLLIWLLSASLLIACHRRVEVVAGSESGWEGHGETWRDGTS